MTDCDAVVVGGGIIGSAVAQQLAASGQRVVICERGRFPGLGATTRSGSLIRQQHTAHCAIPLAVEGLRRYRAWPQTIGGDCGFRRTGFATLVSARLADHLDKNVAAVNEAGGHARRIGADELARLHPALAAPDDAAVGYEPGAGYADPVLATHALLRSARDHGARAAEGVHVRSILTRGDQVSGVRTNLGDISARHVVLCAGAGSAELLEPFPTGAALTPRRIGVAVAELGPAASLLPCGIDDIAHSYFRPLGGTAALFGVQLDTTDDPLREPEPVALADAADAAARLAAHIPGLGEAPVTGTRVGVDTYTPDGHPLIGPSGPAGLYLCTGFSGGGAKSAPAVGALVAGELGAGEPARALAPFRPSRFARGNPIESDFPYDYS